MSDTSPAPAQESTAAPAAPVSPTEEQVTTGAQPQTGNGATPDSEAHTLTEAQRLKKAQETRERIEELAAQNKALREYGEFFRQRYEETRQPPAQATAAPPAQEQPEPEPNADDFDDPKAYAKAYATWTRKENAKEVARAIEQARTEGKSAAEKAFTEAREKERARALDDQFAVRHQEFAQKTPDYMVTISNPALTFMHGEFLGVIKASEKGPELAYYIAKNPQLVARLASKSVPQRLAELGRIEAELSRPPPPPKVTTAPAPPTPIGGGPAQTVKLDEVKDIDEWMARRTKELREKRANR
jgi:hypothetical protein